MENKLTISGKLNQGKELVFNDSGNKIIEIIKFCENGDIFINGRLAENDKEVVDAMREFLRNQGLIKTK